MPPLLVGDCPPPPPLLTRANQMFPGKEKEYTQARCKKPFVKGTYREFHVSNENKLRDL